LESFHAQEIIRNRATNAELTPTQILNLVFKATGDAELAEKSFNEAILQKSKLDTEQPK